MSFWVRGSRLADEFYQTLLMALEQWFADDWPIERPLVLTNEQFEQQVAMFEKAGLQRRFRLDDPKHGADDLAFA